MSEDEQIIVYDTMISIKECAPTLVKLLNERSTPSERTAFKRGIYAAVVRLGSLFNADQMDKHSERHRKSREACDAFFSKEGAK